MFYIHILDKYLAAPSTTGFACLSANSSAFSRTGLSFLLISRITGVLS